MEEMHVVHVFFKIKPKNIEDFRIASQTNATESLKENGAHRFDVMQQKDDSTKFMFAEWYYSVEDQLKHRETAHFHQWKEEIKDYLKEPYSFEVYQQI